MKKQNLNKYESKNKKTNKVSVLVLCLTICLIFTQNLAFAGTSISQFTGKEYTHNDKFGEDYLIVNGLDVSIYQKEIDWQKAKANGVDFAIIRVAGRYYGSGGMYSDDNFVRNMTEAKKYGIQVGVYFFSQAITELEAMAEADYAITLIEEAGYNVNDLELPIFMDYEFAGGESGRLKQAKLTKEQATNVAEAFCDEVMLKGYKPGIYANLTFFTKTIDGAYLGNKYPIWVAQYNSLCQLSSEYTFWQYASSGKVDGINASNDCNFWYIKKEPLQTSDISMVNAEVKVMTSPIFTTKEEEGIPVEPEIEVLYDGKILQQGFDYKVKYIENTKIGMAYMMIMGLGEYTDYKLVPFEIEDYTEFIRIQKLTLGVQSTEIQDVSANPLSPKKVRVDWKKSASGYKVDYYEVWKSTKKSSGYKKAYTTPDSSKKYYINTTGLSKKTTYWYKVRGVREINGKKVYTPFTKVSTKMP